MQENLILAGYDEETAKRLSEALAGTLVPTKALIAALRGLTDATESLADMMRELEAAARPAALRKQQLPRPPESHGKIKYTAARPPARPVCHMNQRGRKR